MPMSVAAALAAFPDLVDGDVVALNDPFAGGTHLPDITLVSPHLDAGRPFAYLATRAHHADVGGMAPGSMPLAREIYQEGLRIPPVRLVRAGALDESVAALIRANVRTPDERMGDLRAQLAAHRTGSSRLAEAVERSGADALAARSNELIAYAERLMRALIRSLPNGTYEFADQLDGDGIGRGPIAIRVSVRIRGASAVVDFAGTDPQCAGGLNAIEAVTRSAVYYAFLCLLVTRTAIDGHASSRRSTPGASRRSRSARPPAASSTPGRRPRWRAETWRPRSESSTRSSARWPRASSGACCRRHRLFKHTSTPRQRVPKGCILRVKRNTDLVPAARSRVRSARKKRWKV